MNERSFMPSESTDDTDLDMSRAAPEINESREGEVEPSPELSFAEVLTSDVAAHGQERMVELKAEVEQMASADDPNTYEARGILQDLDQKFGSITRSVTLAASLLTPASPLYAHENEPLPPEVTATETIETRASTPEAFMDELRGRVWEDDFETLARYVGRGELRELFRFQGKSGAPVIAESYADAYDQNATVDQMLEDDSERSLAEKVRDTLTGEKLTLKTMHNHPIRLMQERYGIRDEQIERMRTGEAPMFVAPPSGHDIDMALKTLEGMDSVHYVTEPSGTWRYDPDEENDALIRKREVMHEVNNHMVEFISSLESHEFQALMAMAGEDGQGNVVSAVEAVDNAEGDHPGIAKLEAWATEMVAYQEERMGPEFVAASERIADIAEQIRSSSARGEDVEAHIHDYIQTARKLGIYVTYEDRRGAVFTVNGSERPIEGMSEYLDTTGK
jgi:hypothetical protein